MNIECMDDIPWSSKQGKAFEEYISLCLLLLKNEGIDLSDQYISPENIVRLFLDGVIDDNERLAKAESFIKVINEESLLTGDRNPSTYRFLKAKLSLCLMTVPSDQINYGDSLEWVLIYLWKLGADNNRLWVAVQNFFSHSFNDIDRNFDME